MKWKELLRPSNKWWILPPILFGFVIVAAILANRRGPRQLNVAEESRPLRVIRVPVVDLIPRVIAYGTAKPGQVWQAVSEVRGRVIEVHPDLKSGSMVRQGEILLKIDPSEYDLAVAQFEADMSQIHSQLDELGTREFNDQASLEIEQASLKLTERDLERVQSLVQQNAVSKSEVDKQDRDVLAQRQSVQPPDQGNLNACPSSGGIGRAKSRRG